MAATSEAARKRAFPVRCLLCGCRWSALLLPMPLHKAAEVLAGVTCKGCGASAAHIVSAAIETGGGYAIQAGADKGPGG